MNAPAHLVLRLVRTMLSISRARAEANAAWADAAGISDGDGPHIDPDHADRIADALAEAEALHGPLQVMAQ